MLTWGLVVYYVSFTVNCVVRFKLINFIVSFTVVFVVLYVVCLFAELVTFDCCFWLFVFALFG